MAPRLWQGGSEFATNSTETLKQIIPIIKIKYPTQQPQLPYEQQTKWFKTVEDGISTLAH